MPHYICILMKRLLVIICVLGSGLLYAQSPYTTKAFNYHLIDRLEITGDSLDHRLFTTMKPYREDIAHDITVDRRSELPVDQFNQKYLSREFALHALESTPPRPDRMLSSFYRSPNALYSVHTDDFGLIVNPVLAFSGASGSDSLPVYRNTRGVEIKGHIQHKLGFYSSITENQARFPQFIQKQNAIDDVLMGATLAKDYGTNARDYFIARGYISFSPMKPITFQFGHDQNFIGDGYRSIILSDAAAPYPFLKINTNIWKLNYTNLYSQHTDFLGYREKAPTSRKYSALHHLSVNIGRNLTIGVFENVIFDRQDSSESGMFDFQYYNPIIFYRAVEHGLNSSDNMVLGIDWKWNFMNRFSWYGQFILDEFVKSLYFSKNNSWVKKYGYQTGIKYINVAGIENLDAQVEVNQIRPHTYQHTFKSQNWIHYNQSLAHPLGSNLREWITILRYQPLPRLQLTGMYSNSRQGVDSLVGVINYGGDPARSTEGLSNTNDVHLFQGIDRSIATVTFNASYMLAHNLYLDAGIFYRTAIDDVYGKDKTMLITFGMRLNAAALDFRNF